MRRPGQGTAAEATRAGRPLRVLVLGLNYAPEPTGIAPYTTGMAHFLADAGHDVHVVTGLPHYPLWRLTEDSPRRRSTERDGDVVVTRVPHPVPARPSGRMRIAMEAVFAARAAVVRAARPDVVVAVSPALLGVAAALSRRSPGRTPLGVVVQDLYSRAVVEAGVLSDWEAGLTYRLERRLLGAADSVVAIHEAFRHSLVRLGVDAGRITTIRNWTHTGTATGDPAALRAALGWRREEFVALHAGNIGAKQGLENVVEAARLAEVLGLPVRFVLLGDGHRRRSLEQLGGGLERLQFLALLPGGEFETALAAADVLVLNERPGIAEMCVPSKLTSYFAAGRPVVSASSPGSAATAEIEASGGGVSVAAGDPAALLGAVLSLMRAPAQATAMGRRGREFAHDVLAERLARDAYVAWVERLAGIASAPAPAESPAPAVEAIPRPRPAADPPLDAPATPTAGRDGPGPLRIAVVHSFHRESVPSGENVVVRTQVDALRAAGHTVTLIGQSNDERGRRPTYRLEAAATTVTGLGPDPTAELELARPDVVHVHNLFPNFGTRWLDRWPGPLVATLHNFRPMCAAGTQLRDGRRCTDCRSDLWAGVRHACFQGSRAASLPLAVAGRHGAAEHPVVRRADRLIAVSSRLVDEYAEAGVDPRRFAVVPNAVDDPAAPGVLPREPRWLFVGRLSAEKGIGELLDAWPAGMPLDVVGDGELAAPLRARVPVPGVRLLGRWDHARVRAALGGYTGLVVPSLWAEAGPPLSYVEALAAGVPTVALVGNGAADDVVLRGTGVVVPRPLSTAELAAALDEVHRRRAELSRRCRAAFEATFSTRAWVDRLLAVYAEAVGARDVGRSGLPTGVRVAP